jgi:hypothetical protein
MMTRDCWEREDDITVDWDVVDWTGLIWPEIETSSGCCEHGHELLV